MCFIYLYILPWTYTGREESAVISSEFLIYIYIYLFIYIFIHVFVNLFSYAIINLFCYIFIYLFLHLSINSSFRLLTYYRRGDGGDVVKKSFQFLSIHWFIHLFVYPYIQSICLSVYHLIYLYINSFIHLSICGFPLVSSARPRDAPPLLFRLRKCFQIGVPVRLRCGGINLILLRRRRLIGESFLKLFVFFLKVLVLH